jgi:hypothetical protein
MTPDEGDAEIAQNFVIGEAGMKAHIPSRPMWHFPLIRFGRTIWMCVVLSRSGLHTMREFTVERRPSRTHPFRNTDSIDSDRAAVGAQA